MPFKKVLKRWQSLAASALTLFLFFLVLHSILHIFLCFGLLILPQTQTHSGYIFTLNKLSKLC